MPSHFDEAKRPLNVLLVLSLLAAVSGCAGNPPVSTVSGADMAINQAMSAKASEYAPIDLQRALDKAARAKQALSDKNYDRARRLAEQAQVDAQAAEARAKSAEAKRTAEEAQKTIETLRHQAQSRGGPGTGAPRGGIENANP